MFKLTLLLIIFISQIALSKVIREDFKYSQSGGNTVSFKIGKTQFHLEHTYSDPVHIQYARLWQVCPGSDGWDIIDSRSFCEIKSVQIDTDKKTLTYTIRKHKPNDEQSRCLKKVESFKATFQPTCS